MDAKAQRREGEADPEPLFPALGAVLSGGHTFLVRISSLGSYEVLGQTVDDAIGEAFDKVAVLLGLPYPGGPEIERLALLGDPTKYPFAAGKVKGAPLSFSFSGLKTNVLYTVKGQNQAKNAPNALPDSEKAHIAASFQETALQDVVQKIALACRQADYKALYLGGGVCNSKRLRALLHTQNLGLPIHFPPPELSLDNAAMIAGLGFHVYQRKGQGDDLDLEPACQKMWGI